MLTKFCTKCLKEKAVSDFSPAGKYLKSQCKPCRTLINTKYRPTENAKRNARIRWSLVTDDERIKYNARKVSERNKRKDHYNMKSREASKRKRVKDIANISDCYLKKKLKERHGIINPPSEFLELKRLELTAKREMKKSTKTN